jgi:hypothetical protein
MGIVRLSDLKVVEIVDGEFILEGNEKSAANAALHLN